MMLQYLKLRHARIVAGLLTVPVIAACSGSDKVPEQVIATGKDFELTIQEYDQVLRSSPPVTKEAVNSMRKVLLDALIDEKLLADEAVKAGLDKSAETAQALEAARRSVLAKAYVSQLTGGSFNPSEQDFQAFYAAHPERYAERKRYVISEIVLRSDLDGVRDYVGIFEKTGFGQLLNSLPNTVARSEPLTVVRYGDEIAGPAVSNLAGLKAGDKIVYQTIGKVHLGEVRSIEASPMPFEDSRQQIAANLLAERNSALVSAALKDAKKERSVAVVNDTLRNLLGKAKGGS